MNELTAVAKRVYIVHRKGAFSGHEAQAAQLLNEPAIGMFDGDGVLPQRAVQGAKPRAGAADRRIMKKYIKFS